jgi:hypothetical protein
MADNNKNDSNGFIIEKLYSPLFVQMTADEYKDDYDGDYWSDPISQQEAVYYEDSIHEAILRERLHTEQPRGLMTYYYRGGTVDEKVFSLNVDVEVHDGKLWGVATLELTEELEPDELDDLRDYISGQYSDGFGEGFEQREIKVGDGELFVSLWESGDQFFIDTQRDFEQRLGISITTAEPIAAVPETPAQAALHEPDASDSEEVAALRERLVERLDNNLTEYIYSLYEYCEVEVTGLSSEISSMAGAHYYLTERHNFHTSELEYLMKFQNPLRVVADQFELESSIEDHSAVMWDFFDKQDALRGDYELAATSVNTVENAHGHKDTEKPSVLEQIRKAREEAKASPVPRRDAPGKDASGKERGPEL